MAGGGRRVRAGAPPSSNSRTGCDHETTYSLGGEWSQTLIPASNGGVATTVAARAGYTYQQDEEDLGDSVNENDVFRGLGFGAGLQFDFGAFGSGFDYAYRDWGRLGGTNNFSVSMLF